MNKIFVRGNLIADPMMRDVEVKGATKKRCSFAVASNYRNKANTEETIIFNVTVWESVADRCAFLRKGSKVFIIGRLKEREYTDKEGNARKSFELVVESIDFIAKEPHRGQNVGESPEWAPSQEQQVMALRKKQPPKNYDDSDLPF